MGNWKKALAEAYQAPPPEGRLSFIRSLGPQKTALFDFVRGQIGYIHKGIWFISAIITAVSLFFFRVMPRDLMWVVSALTPALALAAVCESGRSEWYGMAELELATRFSLRSVVLARLIILALVNGALLGLLAGLGAWRGEVRLLAAGLYILAPFLLTANLSLWVLRSYPGREGGYVCGGIALAVSVSVLLSRETLALYWAERYLPVWAAGALALSLGLVRQYQKQMKRMEELSWN